MPTAPQALLQASLPLGEGASGPRVEGGGWRVGPGRQEDRLGGMRTPGNLFQPLGDTCRNGVARVRAPSIWLTKLGTRYQPTVHASPVGC